MLVLQYMTVDLLLDSNHENMHATLSWSQPKGLKRYNMQKRTTKYWI